MAYAPSPTLLRTASRSAWKKPPSSEEIVEEIYQGSNVMSPAPTPTPTTKSPVSAKEGVRWSPTPQAHTPNHSYETLSFAPVLSDYDQGAANGTEPGKFSGDDKYGDTRGIRSVTDSQASQNVRQPLMQQPLPATQLVAGQTAVGGHTMIGGHTVVGGQPVSHFVRGGTELNRQAGATMTAGLRPNPLANLPRSASHLPYATKITYQEGPIQPVGLTTYNSSTTSFAGNGLIGRNPATMSYGTQPFTTQPYVVQSYVTQPITQQQLMNQPSISYQPTVHQQPTTSYQPVHAYQPVTHHPVTPGNSTGPSAHSASVVRSVPAGSVIGESWEERHLRVPRKIIREEVVEGDAVVREKVIEVARPIIEERVVEVPEIQYVEEVVQVPEVVYKDRVVQGPQVEVQERPVYVPRTEYVDRVVEVPTVNYREVPVRKVVRVPVQEEEVRVKEIPVPVLSETTQDIVTKVDRPYEVPVIHPLPFEVKTTLHQRLPQLVAQPGNTHEYNVYLPRVNEVPINRHLVSDATADQIERERERLFSCLQNGMDAHALVRELDLHKAENRVEETIAEIQQWGKDNLTQNYPRVARAQGTGLTAANVGDSPAELYSHAAGGMHMGGMHMGGMPMGGMHMGGMRPGELRSRHSGYGRPSKLRRPRMMPRRYQHASSVDSFGHQHKATNDCSFFGAPLLHRLFGNRRYRSDQDSVDVGSWDSQYWDSTPLYYKPGATDANPSVWNYIVKQHPDFYN